MSMQKGKHQGGQQTQGYSQQRFQTQQAHATFIRPAAQQRPEVGFHVAAPGFSGPQQGGGPNGPPGGPQGMPRGIHHPGHHGGPPGPGNPSLAPQGSSGGPGQPGGQVQQQSQNQGPAPTSTPPGQDMGKQPPQHLQQGQQAQQMPPGSLQLYNVGVPNQSRSASSQPYYAGPRGPAPRMANHRGQMVNIPNNHVGQQMFSHQVQMQSLPQMYPGSVVGLPAQLQQQMVFGHGQMPIFPGQPRHQNPNAAAYYAQTPGHQPIIMSHQQLYAATTGYPQQHAPSQAGPQYYYQTATPVGMQRPGAGVPGGPGGPQMPQPQPQQVVQGGPPTQQMGQPPVPMSMVSAGPQVATASSGPQGGPPSLSRASSGMRRKFALDIIDPKTGKSISSEIYVSGSSAANSPPGSENSSARQTPQPPAGADSAADVIADFAARVAKVASEDSTLQPFSEGSSPTPSNEVAEPVSIQDQSEFDSSKPIVGVDDNQWKTPLLKSASLKSELVKDNDTVKKLDTVENNNVKVVTEVERSFPKEFVPQSVSYKDSVIPKLVDVTKESVSEIQPIQVIINKEPQPILENNSTPVVSANANTPAITLVHKTKTDSFPSLKNSQVNQSPRRKQTQPKETTPIEAKGARSVSVEKNVAQNVQLVPNLAVSSTTQSADGKVAKKEEFAVPQVPPSKERRDQKKEKGVRGRRDKSSQSRERGDKSRTSSERKLSQSRERESGSRKHSKSRERETEKQQRAKTPQPAEKSATPPKEVEVVVAPVVPVPAPVVAAPPPAEEVKQANGEVPVESADGKATKQHQQNAKGAKRGKMRTEQNRKVSEESGDAEVPAAEPEVAPPAALPVEVPAVPVPTPAAETVPVVVETLPVVNQIAKEEIDTEKLEQEESEKMVLALNEENAKVSAAALKDDVPAVIENVTTETVPKPPPPFHKTLSYKDDQWSPSNLEGKKKYDRDFLMELKEDPQSKKKPENLPDMDVVLKDSNNRQQNRGGMADQRAMVNRNHSENNFTPGFMRTGGSNSRGPPPKRPSQQGKQSASKGGKPGVIHMTLSLREDVKLHETENAWKPGVMKKVGGGEGDMDELNKAVRGVLNKLTPQKFDTLVSQVQALPIDNSDKLQNVINLVFEKAVDEPGFSVAYAQMCKVLSGMQVPAERKSPEDPEFVNFRKLIVNRCQAEFEKNNEAELNKEAKLKEINLQTDPDKKKELMLIYEEEERKVRMKSVGNIRFIGELFKLQMLTTSIMHRCIRHLLTSGDGESLECLCKLLTTVGKDLESKVGPNNATPNDLSPYIQRMRDIATKRGQGSVSSRVRFMIQDVIELRQGKWIPRRDDANPKTMDQIQKEAEKETMDMHIALSNQPQTPGRRGDDRGGRDDRDRRGGGGGGSKSQRDSQQTDGWTSVPARTNRNLVVDTSKMKVNKDEMNTVNLGSGNQFSKWSMGAGGASKSTEKKPAQPYNTNLYSVLQDSAPAAAAAVDEKRGSGPPLSMMGQRPGPGKVTPSPSIEKERMLASFKMPGDVDRSSRSSSVQKSSRPSSRDNSSLRGGMGSQPGSVSASNEDISRTQPDKTSSVSNAKPHELSFDDIAKKAKLVVGELVTSNLVQDCGDTVKETFISAQKHEFVRECINDVLEKSSKSRTAVGQFMVHLIQNNIISIQQYLRGFSEILEIGDDIAIDVPKIWLYLAEIIVPIMSSELLSFVEFRGAVQPTKATQIVVEALQLLVKDKGPGWIRERWDKAGLKWTDFLEQGLVDDFVKNNKLEYTIGAPSANQSMTCSSSLPMDEIRQKITTFLKAEQSGSTPSFDQLCDWIGANVGDRVSDPLFIRALMTAVCESAIYYYQNTTWKLKENVLQQHQKLLLKYVDNKEDRELQCIYAVQSLINKLEHPQGLLCAIFQDLYDNNVFSYDAFIAWETSEDPAEKPGKGVALKSLTSFFTALKESESSCDES